MRGGFGWGLAKRGLLHVVRCCKPKQCAGCGLQPERGHASGGFIRLRGHVLQMRTGLLPHQEKGGLRHPWLDMVLRGVSVDVNAALTVSGTGRWAIMPLGIFAASGASNVPRRVPDVMLIGRPCAFRVQPRLCSNGTCCLSTAVSSMDTQWMRFPDLLPSLASGSSVSLWNSTTSSRISKALVGKNYGAGLLPVVYVPGGSSPSYVRVGTGTSHRSARLQTWCSQQFQHSGTPPRCGDGPPGSPTVPVLSSRPCPTTLQEPSPPWFGAWAVQLSLEDMEPQQPGDHGHCSDSALGISQLCTYLAIR